MVMAAVVPVALVLWALDQVVAVVAQDIRGQLILLRMQRVEIRILPHGLPHLKV
jgi:hypothetical protein